MMKAVLILYLFWATIPVVFAGHMNDCVPEGRWYNSYSDRTILVKSGHNYIKIKGLRSRNGWTYFDRRGSQIFVDIYGNTIRRKNDDVFVFTDRFRHTRWTFIYEGHRRSRWDERRYDRDDAYFDFTEDRHLSAADRKYQDDDFDNLNDGYAKAEKYNTLPPSSGKNLVVPISLEGVWTASGIDAKVYVVDTRDGIKVRLSNEKKWYVYNWDKKAGLLLSEDGQSYTLVHDSRLVWRDKTHSKIIYLEKSADTWDD